MRRGSNEEQWGWESQVRLRLSDAEVSDYRGVSSRVDWVDIHRPKDFKINSLYNFLNIFESVQKMMLK
jgi:hypothetical protein